MSGYVDEPKDLPDGSPYWYMVGRNGYWAVDERTTGQTGARCTSATLASKREATAVTGALNDAYRRGVMLGWREAATAFIRTGHVDPELPEGLKTAS
jgi:hypothetical protein